MVRPDKTTAPNSLKEGGGFGQRAFGSPNASGAPGSLRPLEHIPQLNEVTLYQMIYLSNSIKQNYSRPVNNQLLLSVLKSIILQYVFRMQLQIFSIHHFEEGVYQSSVVNESLQFIFYQLAFTLFLQNYSKIFDDFFYYVRQWFAEYNLSSKKIEEKLETDLQDPSFVGLLNLRACTTLSQFR